MMMSMMDMKEPIYKPKMSRFTRFSWVRLKLWEPCLCKTFDKFHIWLFLPVWPNVIIKQSFGDLWPRWWLSSKFVAHTIPPASTSSSIRRSQDKFANCKGTNNYCHHPKTNINNHCHHCHHCQRQNPKTIVTKNKNPLSPLSMPMFFSSPLFQTSPF